MTGRRLGLLLMMVASSCYALEMARIQTPHGQDLTSSTLEWRDLRAGQDLPDNSVHITPDGPVWCRAKVRGLWSAGSIEEGKCITPFLANVKESTQYDVLVSINGSARIIEQDWDRLQAIPDHGILTPDVLLGVSHGENGEVYPGYVSSKERRAYILKEGKSKRQDKATILTEDEPVEYVVSHVVRDESKSKLSKSEEVVAQTTLVNSDKSVQLTDDMLDFTAKEKIYWGRIRGTITGLTSTVNDPSGNQWEITWGIENELDRMVEKMIAYELPGEASINVTLVAVMHKYEAPYSARLKSIYSDKVEREHPIAGLHIHTYMAELRADFSQPYFTVNKTEISGEYMSSQILVHSTTTTTTTTTNTPVTSSSTSDGEKPQSGSLATSGSGDQTHPVAEHMSSANINCGSFWFSLSIVFCIWCLTQNDIFTH